MTDIASAMPRVLLAVVLPLAASLYGCDPPPDPQDEDVVFFARVDCPAMNWNPTYGNSNETYPTLLEGITPMPLQGELTPSEIELNLPESAGRSRCYYRIPHNAMQAGKQQIAWEIDGDAYLKGSIFQIYYRGVPWTYLDGEFVVDEIDGEDHLHASKGSGHFDARFSSNGEIARFEGEFDWCDQLRHGDCPYAVNSADQPKWEVTSDWTVTHGTAAECRMVIDEASGGMQVDMQIGSWMDADVTQIYGLWCGWVGEHINANRFTFQAGGVTGPGAYGPLVTYDSVGGNFSQDYLPKLDWKLPLTLSWIFPNETQGCALSLANPGHIVINGGTECSFIVDEDHFTLDCDSVTYQSGFFGTPQPGGAFHFESDCSLVTLAP